MALAHKKTPSVVYGIGLVLVYLGERIVEPGRSAGAITILGLLALGTAFALAIVRGRGRPAGRMLPLLQGIGLVALALYFCRATLPELLGHRALEASAPKLDVILAALWPALMLASTLGILMVEFSMAGMARAPAIDARRVRAAMLSGLGCALALVFCFAVGYVASERNLKADLSFFRTARASQATKQLVAALDQPVNVTLFYPPANEVAEELVGYFDELRRASANIVVEQVDQAVDPARAKALNVSSNGYVAISRDKLHEQLQIPVKLEEARGKLRNLDQDVYKRILQVSRGRRTAYLVQGHEERTFSARDGNQNASVGLLKDLLSSQNVDTRELGLAQGLASDVPTDAALVLWLGPQKPLLPEESASLVRYFRRGGRLLIAVDPDAAQIAKPVLEGLGLDLSSYPLANDRIYWARTHQKSDRTGIVPINYSTHAALPTLSSYGTQLPLVLLTAGALTRAAAQPTPAPTIDFIIKTDGATWEDKNGDFELDKDSEERKSYAVAAAVSLKPVQPAKPAGKGETPTHDGRAFVLGDSDAFSDLMIKNTANAYMTVDAIRWLLGEPEAAGPISSEVDVPVRHTRKQDVFWFYSTIFLVPTMVLLAGWLVTRKRRRREVTS
jgi:hypothetical protein